MQIGDSPQLAFKEKHMPSQAPWTEVGRLQSDMHQIRSTLQRKADSHEVHSLARRLDGVERALREVRTDVAGLCSRLQALEETE